jgi:hypothetical protein
MFGSTAASASHRETVFCKNGTATYQKRKASEEHQRIAAETVFTVNGEPIETEKQFKYLGRLLSDDDSDDMCVERNLKRAKQQLGMICGILSNEPASPKVMASFNKSVVQSVLHDTSTDSVWHEKSTLLVALKPPDDHDYPYLIAITSRGPVKRAAWDGTRTVKYCPY